jgi:hypothetical protein
MPAEITAERPADLVDPAVPAGFALENIGLQPHAAGPPLAAYLRSLELVAAYDQAEALPAHEYRFHGLADRVRMLLAHHERRCEEVIVILARHGPAPVWQVTQELSWSRGWASVTGLMRRAAIAEAAAHLRHLADEGRVSAAAPAADEPERYGLPVPGREHETLARDRGSGKGAPR